MKKFTVPIKTNPYPSFQRFIVGELKAFGSSYSPTNTSYVTACCETIAEIELCSLLAPLYSDRRYKTHAYEHLTLLSVWDRWNRWHRH